LRGSWDRPQEQTEETEGGQFNRKELKEPKEKGQARK